MGRASNYADAPSNTELAAAGPLAIEHRIFHHDFRKFTPHGGPNGEHLEGHLGEGVVQTLIGPYPADPGNSTREELERQMPTYRPQRHPRACGDCGLTACLSLISHVPVACA